MQQPGIFETMLSEIKALKSLVISLQDNAGDGIGRVMNIPEAAEYLGLTENGVRDRIRKNKLPYIKNLHGQIVLTEKYLKRAQLATTQKQISDLAEEMRREFAGR